MMAAHQAFSANISTQPLALLWLKRQISTETKSSGRSSQKLVAVLSAKGEQLNMNSHDFGMGCLILRLPHIR